MEGLGGVESLEVVIFVIETSFRGIFVSVERLLALLVCILAACLSCQVGFNKEVALQALLQKL